MVLVNDGETNSSSANEAGLNNDKDKKRNKKHKSHIPDTNPNTDNDAFLKLLIDVSKKLSQQLKRFLYFVLIDLGGKQKIDRFVQWCVRHPQLALCLLAAVLVTSLPILMFMAFALTTFVMTFTGFLVLEGTLLTIITMVMFGLLGALGIVLLFCVLVGLATYFGVSHFYDVYDGTESQRTNLRNYMQKYNQTFTSLINANPNRINNRSTENVGHYN